MPTALMIKKKMTHLRYGIGAALNGRGSSYIDVDACIPIAYLSEYIQKVEEICKINNVELAYFGHALER